MKQKTHNRITAVTSIISSVGVILLIFQLYQTGVEIKNNTQQFKLKNKIEQQRLALNIVTRWNSSVTDNLLSCMQFYGALDHTRQMLVLTKKIVLIPSKEKNISDDLYKCLPDNIETKYFSKQKLNEDGSTFVAGEISRTINILSDVALAWHYGGDKQILDSEFGSILKSKFIKKILESIRSNKQTSHAGEAIVYYLKKNGLTYSDK